MAVISRSLPGAARRSQSGYAGNILAALFVALTVIVSAAVVSGQPSGGEDCVRDVCPR